MPEMGTHSYRCGWDDADVEMRETARHQRVIEEGNEDDFGVVWGVLFDTGGDARTHGIAFDAERNAPLKEGWIAADINMGVAGKA